MCFFFCKWRIFKPLPCNQKFRPVCQVWIKNFHISLNETENQDPINEPSNFKYGMYSAIGLLLSYGTYHFATSEFIY